MSHFERYPPTNLRDLPALERAQLRRQLGAAYTEPRHLVPDPHRVYFEVRQLGFDLHENTDIQRTVLRLMSSPCIGLSTSQYPVVLVRLTHWSLRVGVKVSVQSSTLGKELVNIPRM